MDLPSMIDAILEFLASDGGPHSVKEISTALNFPLDACENIVRFLIRYNFAQLENTKLRIDKKTQAFVFNTRKEAPLQATLSH
jgi:hypothetical protein